MGEIWLFSEQINIFMRSKDIYLLKEKPNFTHFYEALLLTLTAICPQGETSTNLFIFRLDEKLIK